LVTDRLQQSSNLRICRPAIHDSRGSVMAQNQTVSFGEVHRFVERLFDGDLHAKRVLSLTNATLGVIQAGALCLKRGPHRLSITHNFGALKQHH
jgi:hypothetical protein